MCCVVCVCMCVVYIAEKIEMPVCCVVVVDIESAQNVAPDGTLGFPCGQLSPQEREREKRGDN